MYEVKRAILLVPALLVVGGVIVGLSGYLLGKSLEKRFFPQEERHW